MTKKMFNWYKSCWAHKLWVFAYILQFCWSLFWRGVRHDWSKFGMEERYKFADLLPRLKETTYGSPEYKKLLNELGYALYCHYRDNPHHPEHYADMSIGSNSDEPEEIKYNYPVALPRMNLLDFVEMFIDWRAAVKKHEDGDIVKSIKHNKKRYHYNDIIESILLNTVKARK